MQTHSRDPGFDHFPSGAGTVAVAVKLAVRSLPITQAFKLAVEGSLTSVECDRLIDMRTAAGNL